MAVDLLHCFCGACRATQLAEKRPKKENMKKQTRKIAANPVGRESADSLSRFKESILKYESKSMASMSVTIYANSVCWVSFDRYQKRTMERGRQSQRCVMNS